MLIGQAAVVREVPCKAELGDQEAMAKFRDSALQDCRATLLKYMYEIVRQNV